MNKYKLLTLVLVTVLLSACGTTTKKADTTENNTTPTATPTIAKKNLVWNDEAGFVFSYPEDIKVDANTTDDTSYANLKTSDNVKIMAVDSKYKNLTDWLSNFSTYKDKTVADTTISGKTAKKVTMANSTIVGIIDDGILFTIEVPKVTTSGDLILQTFELVYPTQKPAVKGTTKVESDGGDIVAEEEIVE